MVLYADLKSTKIQHLPLLRVLILSSFSTSTIFTEVPIPGTNPVQLGSSSCLRYLLSLGRKRSSSHLQAALSTTMGLNCSSRGMSGQTLFRGISLARKHPQIIFRASGRHQSFSNHVRLVYFNQVSDIASSPMAFPVEHRYCRSHTSPWVRGGRTPKSCRFRSFGSISPDTYLRWCRQLEITAFWPTTSQFIFAPVDERKQVIKPPSRRVGCSMDRRLTSLQACLAQGVRRNLSICCV